MTAAQSFQRARKPQEISQRREQLLAAAAELFDEQGPQGAGLNAIAAKAGFTKSNVYRYFESREQVLLELFHDEFTDLIDAAIEAMQSVPLGDIEALADAITHCFLARPRCCALISILASTLEQNVSEATIAETKTHMGTQNARIVAALSARLPTASPADCAWAIAMIGSLVAGMWPGAHPPPAGVAVLARPEFAHMRIDVGRDLRRAAAALLTSIV
ncbi:TetR/AcrR family transcriptional regulator [Devosia oryziradicis]|uniref:TetR/AcrR family transcriptional regulator n=1 Tax=Devosia oryziradicis TaxID=2801335 RepID=A0ABX7C0Q1_9HYPH|nr:TetR/AcrR family transcriptional regulator [Devosia oryziradicis]QQR36834.1 TetR/AcrR family transcriptional regulator [Devosia oryziradicis]